MKRVLAQEVEPTSSWFEAAEKAVSQQHKSVLPGSNRKVRTSAAMIGLALSMGASSILLPHQDDGAAAAEPGTSGIAALPLPKVQGSTSSASASGAATFASASAVRYTVRAGQTLWQIAQQHGVEARDVAVFNNLSVGEVLHVGQVLRIPSSDGGADAVQENASPKLASSKLTLENTDPSAADFSAQDQGLLQSEVSSFSAEDELLKQQQHQSVDELRQKQDALRLSLESLKSEDKVPGVAELAELEAEGVQENADDLRLASANGSVLQGADVGQAATASSLGSKDAVATSKISSNLLDDAQFAAIELKPGAGSQLATQHEVAPGETLDKISDAYGVSSRELASANQIDDPYFLEVGRSLIIPTSQSSSEVGGQGPSTLVTSSSESSLNELALAPQLSTGISDATGANSWVYQVQPGDTLDTITYSLGISRDDLMTLNRLSNPDVIVAGMTLMVPPASLTEVPTADKVASLPSTGRLLEEANQDTHRFEASSAAEVPVGGKEPAATASDDVASDDLIALGSTKSHSNPYVATLRSEIEAIRAKRSSSSNEVVTSDVNQSPEEVALGSYNSSSLRSPEELEISVSEGPVSESPYISALREEVEGLRQRQRSLGLLSEDADEISAAREIDSEVAAASPSSIETRTERSVNSEFDGTYRVSAAPLQERIQSFQDTNIESDLEVEPASPEASDIPEHLLAAAPLGAESYEPLVEPMTGRVVSPDLPSMPESGEYLPESPALFNGYIWPAQGVLTSGYGWRWGRMHHGIDIAAPVGTPIYAAASGVVETSGWNSGGYGNLVEVRHPDGSLTLYAHNSRLLVRKGQKVTKGQQLAEMGSTGYSTGPHLHFEVHVSGQGSVNPIAYLPGK